MAVGVFPGVKRDIGERSSPQALEPQERYTCVEGSKIQFTCLTMLRRLQIIQLSPSRRPLNLLTLDPYPSPATTSFDETGNSPSQTRYAITSVSWAPSCGRSTHLIATGSRDGHVRIWRVKRPDGSGEEPNEGKWSGRIAADIDDHK